MNLSIFFSKFIFFCDLNETKIKSLSQNNVNIMLIIKKTYPIYLILPLNIVERNNNENSVKRLIINDVFIKVIEFNFPKNSLNSIYF